MQQQYLLLSGVIDFSENYTERELLWKIVNLEEHWRQLWDCVSGELRFLLGFNKFIKNKYTSFWNRSSLRISKVS